MKIKAWPHMTIVAVVVALIAGLGVAYWLKHEQTTSAEELPYAARIQRVDGEVAFSEHLQTVMLTLSGSPLLPINPSPWEIESTPAITRAPRSLSADAILHGSIPTLHLT